MTWRDSYFGRRQRWRRYANNVLTTIFTSLPLSQPKFFFQNSQHQKKKVGM